MSLQMFQSSQFIPDEKYYLIYYKQHINILFNQRRLHVYKHEQTCIMNFISAFNKLVIFISSGLFSFHLIIYSLLVSLKC